MPPQMAPPTSPINSTRGTSTTAGRPGTASAVMVESSPPAIICPSPPILITLARKATQMPVPTSSRGMAFAADSASSSVPPNAPTSSSL